MNLCKPWQRLSQHDDSPIHHGGRIRLQSGKRFPPLKLPETVFDAKWQDWSRSWGFLCPHRERNSPGQGEKRNSRKVVSHNDVPGLG